MSVERLPEPGDEIWRVYCADHLSRYHFAIAFAQDKAVLDAGSGNGYGSAILKASGATRVDGLDIDELSVKHAQQRFGHLGVNYLVGDCETLDQARPTYDLVCSFENIEHLHNPEAFLRSAARVLAADGVLICSTPDRVGRPYINGRPVNPYHVREWYREEFREMLLAHFGRVEMLVEVKSHWLKRREEAANYLQQAIDRHDTTLTGVVLRALGKAGRLLKWRTHIDPWRFGGLQGLAAASPDDYPILHESLVPAYGLPLCHVAVCRAPKRNE